MHSTALVPSVHRSFLAPPGMFTLWLTTPLPSFSFCLQTRNGPICPLWPWYWRTSSTHPRSRGPHPKTESSCSPSQQPRVLRNLLTRCALAGVCKKMYCGNCISFPPVPCVCLPICETIVSWIMECASVFQCVCGCVWELPCWFPQSPNRCEFWLHFSRCLNEWMRFLNENLRSGLSWVLYNDLIPHQSWNAEAALVNRREV